MQRAAWRIGDLISAIYFVQINRAELVAFGGQEGASTVKPDATNGPIEPQRSTSQFSETKIRKWFKNKYVPMCLEKKIRPTEAEVLTALRDKFNNKKIPRRVARELLQNDDTPEDVRRGRGQRGSGRDTPQLTK